VRKSVLSRLPKIVLALLIQFFVLGILAIGVWVVHYWIAPPYPLWLLVGLQGLLAAVLSCKLGLPCWWRWIQFFLPVGLYLGISFQLGGIWALVGFLLLYLVFFNASKERVPLYLSNDTTREALKTLAEKYQEVRFLDLGSGLGGTVAFMSQLPNVERADGVETAPLPYLLSKILTTLKGGEIYWMSLWKADLSQYNLVYAFLSPEPMPKLWHKVITEMQSGAIFVTNSFAVPDVKPTEIWELEDSRQTKLFIYQIEDEGQVASALKLSALQTG